MEKKYKILLNYSSSDSDIKPLRCGSMTKKEIQQYLGKLIAIKKIPFYSCARRLKAQFDNTESSIVELSNLFVFPDAQRLETKCCLNLYITHDDNNNMCYSHDCLKNIKNGKCKDTFVIENIGKKFFADKYKENNQKQR